MRRLALASPRLRRILLAYTLNRLGSWFGLIALMIAVYDHTHSATAVAGLLLCWQALPAFVVPAVVARVELSKRRRELSGLYAFEALVTAVIVVMLHDFSLPAILVLAAIDGTAALAASSLLRAEVARVAREDSVGASESPEDAEREANALLNLAFSLTFVAGPALAGVIVATSGASTALWIDVGSFLLCSLLLLDLHPHVEEAGGEGVRDRLRAAWRHINEVPSFRALLLIEMVALVFFESAAPIELSYAKSTLGAGDKGFGLLVTCWGAGAVLGSVLFARLVSRPLGVLLSAGTLSIGLAYVGFALAPSLAFACPAAFLGGIGNGMQWPSMVSVVQLLTPPALHARLMSALESMSALSTALGLALGGVLVALSSPRIAFLVVGLGAAVTTAALLRAVPAERARDAGAPAPE
jgi:MFS family permease